MDVIGFEWAVRAKLSIHAGLRSICDPRARVSVVCKADNVRKRSTAHKDLTNAGLHAARAQAGRGEPQRRRNVGDECVHKGDEGRADVVGTRRRTEGTRLGGRQPPIPRGPTEEFAFGLAVNRVAARDRQLGPAIDLRLRHERPRKQETLCGDANIGHKVGVSSRDERSAEERRPSVHASGAADYAHRDLCTSGVLTSRRSIRDMNVGAYALGVVAWVVFVIARLV